MKYKKTNTLTFQLSLCFAAILLCLAILFVINWDYVKQVDRNNDAINALNRPYASLYKDMDTLSRSVSELGYQSDGTPEQESGTETAEHMRTAAHMLMDVLNADGYNRISVDLYHTIDHYIQTYAEIMQNYSEHLYSEASKGIVEARRTEEWVRLYLAQMQDTIADIQEARQLRSDSLLTRYNRRMLVLCVLIFTMCLMTLCTTAKRFIAPIQHLCKVVKAFRLTDDPEVLRTQGIPCRKGSLQEITTLATAIYSMQDTVLGQYAVDKSNEQLRRKLDEEALRSARIEQQLQETRLMALQAQINPHFLFNTLNMISQMSYIEGAEHTTELLETFSDFFRYNVDNFDKSVSLAEEIDNARGYMQLQKERFGARIRFTVEAEGALGDIAVPCLIIQPLVENAITHGLRMKTESGEVVATVRRTDGNGFTICVQDNGCGMEPEKLKELIAHVSGIAEEKASVHKSIGLSNVFKRLNLAFGSRASFEAESTPGEGLRITLRVKGESPC